MFFCTPAGALRLAAGVEAPLLVEPLLGAMASCSFWVIVVCYGWIVVWTIRNTRDEEREM